MTYRLEIAAIAKRQFKQLPDDVQSRLRAKIESLASCPRPHGSRKLIGYQDVYRIRAGRYRVIYSVDDEKVIVLILKLGHRRGVYRR